MHHKIMIVVAALLLSLMISGILPHTSVRLAAEEDATNDKDDMAYKARKREQCMARCLEKYAQRNPLQLSKCTARCKEKSF